MRRYAGAAVAALVLLAAAVLVGSCMSWNREDEGGAGAGAKFDPVLRRLAAERPDSIVGVLVRTAGPIDAEARARLEAAGLVIGSVVGEIVTGRIRASAVPSLARLPFVVYVEAARRVPPVGPNTRSSRSD